MYILAVFVGQKYMEHKTKFELRKPMMIWSLIFLHWYHHATVSVYCWWMCGNQLPGGVVFMTVNIFVHSVMYTYYALRAAGVRIPKKIAVSITSIQIVQMVV